MAKSRGKIISSSDIFEELLIYFRVVLFPYSFKLVVHLLLKLYHPNLKSLVDSKFTRIIIMNSNDDFF